MNKSSYKSNTGVGLVFGIPTLGRLINLDWALSFKALAPPINFNTTFSIVKNREVADARNAIAETALAQDAKYLFFLSDDVICPNFTLRQLIFRLENDITIDVVGGVYCSKSNPPAPLVFRGNGQGSYWDWKIGEFFEVTGLGMDCTLIRAETLRKLPKPWFKTVDSDKFLDGVNSAESWTEDLWFFNQLSTINGKVFCDASVICEHWDFAGNKKFVLPPGSLPYRQQISEVGVKKVLIYGPKLDLVGNDYSITECPKDYRVQLNNLPFESEEFDWVIVSEVQYNLPSLDEVLRVLKPGGKLSVCFDDIINRTYLSIKYESYGFKTKVDGSYVEWIRPDGTNSQPIQDNIS